MWPFRNKDKHPEKNNGEVLVQRLKLQLSERDKVRQMIRHELFTQAIGKAGHETMEEADDFDLPDGDEWVSPYEEKFEPQGDDLPPADVQVPEPPKDPGAAPEPPKPE